MRLLIATPEYPPHEAGGIARFYATLAPALVRAGCDVTVVVASPYSDAFPSYEHDGVRVHFVPAAAIDRCSMDMPHLSAAPLFRRLVAAARAGHAAAAGLGPFDVIEATDFALPFVPFLLDGAPTPVAVQCHGSIGQIAAHEPRRADVELDHALAKLTEATLLPLADAIQTPGSPNAAEWTARLGRAVRVLAPPLKVESADVWDAGTDGLVLGRIQPWKGPEVLCRALRLIPAAERPRISWAGRDTNTAPDGGSFDAWLRRQYPDVWGTAVRPLGQRSREEARDLRRHARCVVVPSDWDVFNYTAAEAMADRRLVVCSNAAGASDLIVAGATGFTFQAGDAQDLAHCLRTAMALEPSAALSVGERARAVARARLDPDRVAAERMAAYREMAGSAPRPKSADWIAGFFSGHESAHVGTAFLDQIGIRELSQYLGTRIGRRVVPRSSAADAKGAVS